MKCGRPTQNEMNEFCELVHSVLSRKQQLGVCIMLAPFLVSEKQSGYRGQLRQGLFNFFMTCLYYAAGLGKTRWTRRGS